MRAVSAAAVAWVLALGCGGNRPAGAPDGGNGGGGAGGGGAGGTGITTFDEVFDSNRDLDVLFMVDNSLSMQPLINKLAQNFPTFIQVLQALPTGLPSIHIAVVSSSLGAGAAVFVPNCPMGGDGGEFQYMVGTGTAEPGGAPCPRTGLNDNGQHFISNVAGVANYDETFSVSSAIPPGIATVFSCIASLGDHGCGFEHQLASVARALSKDDVTSADGQPVPSNNIGFLRQDALLAIILVTNEDDCSAPSDSGMFDTSSRYVADPLGPLWSYRCNEFGHLCNGQPPSRTMSFAFGPGECVPAEERGMLIPVHTLVDQIKSLKADPTQIVVSAIAGPPDPYSMTLIPPQLPQDPSMWPNMDHSCTTPNTNPPEFGDPGVRIKAFVDAFGPNGLFLPVCANSFAPALMIVAQELAKRQLFGCLTQTPAPVDPSAADPQYQCAALLDIAGATTPLPACTAANASSGGPCYQLVKNTGCGPIGLQLEIGGTPPDPSRPYGVDLRCVAASSP